MKDGGAQVSSGGAYVASCSPVQFITTLSVLSRDDQFQE